MGNLPSGDRAALCKLQDDQSRLRKVTQVKYIRVII